MKTHGHNPFGGNGSVEKVPVPVDMPGTYDAAVQFLSDEGRSIFTGHMNGGLWNGRVMDACRMSISQGDEAAYEFLLKYGDQYASTLPNEQQHEWRSIKKKAAAMLRCNRDSKCDKFTKTTIGFVSQEFRKQDDGRFICTWQDFIAGDQCDYEDAEDNPIEPPDYEYQPFNMTLLSSSRIIGRVRDALSGLDVGGEQSRQFASEIEVLGKLLKDLGSKPQD